MVEKGFVTQAQADAADREPVRLAAPSHDDEATAPEVVDVVRRTLAQARGRRRAARGGYTVTPPSTRCSSAPPAARRAAGCASSTRATGYRGPLVAPGQRRPAGLGQRRCGPSAPAGRGALPGHIYLGVVERAEDPTRGPRRARGAGGAARGAACRGPRRREVRRNTHALAVRARGGHGAGERRPAHHPRAPGTMRLELGPQARWWPSTRGPARCSRWWAAYDALPGMFNRATRAQRQPGQRLQAGAVLLRAASRRYTLASTVDPNPGCFGAGRGRGAPPRRTRARGVIEPPMRLREALAQSRNMVAARVMEALGPEAVIEHARALGHHLPDALGPLALALGSGSVTPIELTNAYATWAARRALSGLVCHPRGSRPRRADAPLPARAPARVRRSRPPRRGW
jgi:penicillin-binding protein 1A